LARAHTELGIQTLAGIARNSTSDTARVQAVGMLLDRGWGKAPQPHTGEDGETIRVVIRTITEGAPPMPSCRVLRPAGSLGGVVGVVHSHPPSPPKPQDDAPRTRLDERRLVRVERRWRRLPAHEALLAAGLRLETV